MPKGANPAIRASRATTRVLRESPITLVALGGVVLLIVWAADLSGFPLTHWAPGALVALGLLAVALIALPLSIGSIPMSVRVATMALVAYTALSYLSILWAKVPADALEGADRTLLFLVVFSLFALWRQTARGAALLLIAWIAALSMLALFVLVHLSRSGGGLASMFTEGRLIYPAGYANAAAAQWLLAFWPAVLLVRSERLHFALRGALAACAVLLGGLALLSQSRGSVYASAILLVLVFAVFPGRLRSFVVLAVIGAGLAVSGRYLLRVGDQINDGHDAHPALHTAATVLLCAALAVGLTIALLAAWESRSRVSGAARARLRRLVELVAAITLIAAVGGALATGPVGRVEHAWHTFKAGYSANSNTTNRLVGGFGSNRYDFYRVALNQFRAHPLLGIGADNFAEPYLREGHSDETPHYPHSVELRTLSQGGIVGSLIALVGLAAALLAAFAAVRAAIEPLARSVAAAALAGFLYWLMHGSFDWFFEYAGLGASAFALLGLACSLAPAPAWVFHAGPRIPRPLWALALSIVGLACVGALTAPWLSQLELQHAAKVWPNQPQRAYSELDQAAALNPLSARPYLIAGSIALRLEQLPRADREFTRALGRDGENAYALLELGAIASTNGERARALALLDRARRQNPRDPLTRSALARQRSGGRVDIAQLNGLIFQQAQRLQ